MVTLASGTTGRLRRANPRPGNGDRLPALISLFRESYQNGSSRPASKAELCFPLSEESRFSSQSHFHRRWLTEVSWLRLLPQLVSSLPRPKSESGSFQLGVATSGFRLVAFTPWDNLNSTHLWTRDKGKKLKILCTFHVQKSVFLQRVRGRVFQAKSAHIIHRIFHTALKSFRIVSREEVLQTVF